jgi:hypothetical protein
MLVSDYFEPQIQVRCHIWLPFSNFFLPPPKKKKKENIIYSRKYKNQNELILHICERKMLWFLVFSLSYVYIIF